MERINLTPAAPTMLAPLEDLRQLFQAYRDDRGKRTKRITKAGLDMALKRFLSFWEQRGAEVEWQLTPDELLAYNDWLTNYVSAQTGQPLAWNSRNDALRRLRQCLRWAFNRGYIPNQHWLAYIPQPVGAKAVKSAPDLGVWRALYKALGESDTPLRDKTLFAVLAGTGMRRGECAALRLDDIRFLEDGSGFATIRDSKTGRGRIAAFDDIVGDLLKQYIRSYELRDGWLFPTPLAENGDHLTPIAIGRSFNRAAARAGVADRFTGSHDIRRSYATEWTRKLPGEGYSWILARQLGHTIGAGMTSYYAKVNEEDIRRTLMKERCSLFVLMQEGNTK